MDESPSETKMEDKVDDEKDSWSDDSELMSSWTMVNQDGRTDSSREATPVEKQDCGSDIEVLQEEGDLHSGCEDIELPTGAPPALTNSDVEVLDELTDSEVIPSDQEYLLIEEDSALLYNFGAAPVPPEVDPVNINPIHDEKIDSTDLSVASSLNTDVSVDLGMSTERRYIHVPNKRLNITLNLVVAIALLFVFGFGFGHYIGWSSHSSTQFFTRSIQDEMVTCQAEDDARMMEFLLKIDKLQEENDRLKKSIEDLSQTAMTSTKGTDSRKFREEINLLQNENADLKEMVAKIRYKSIANQVEKERHSRRLRGFAESRDWESMSSLQRQSMLYGAIPYELDRSRYQGQDERVEIETNDEPNEDTSDEPGQETSDEPGQETSDEPGQETSDEPGQETSDEPGQETIEEPGQETNDEPGQETSNQADETIYQPDEETSSPSNDKRVIEGDSYDEGFELKQGFRKRLAEVKEYRKRMEETKEVPKPAEVSSSVRLIKMIEAEREKEAQQKQKGASLPPIANEDEHVSEAEHPKETLQTESRDSKEPSAESPSSEQPQVYVEEESLECQTTEEGRNAHATEEMPLIHQIQSVEELAEANLRKAILIAEKIGLQNPFSEHGTVVETDLPDETISFDGTTMTDKPLEQEKAAEDDCHSSIDWDAVKDPFHKFFESGIGDAFVRKLQEPRDKILVFCDDIPSQVLYSRLPPLTIRAENALADTFWTHRHTFRVKKHQIAEMTDTKGDLDKFTLEERRRLYFEFCRYIKAESRGIKLEFMAMLREREAEEYAELYGMDTEKEHVQRDERLHAMPEPQDVPVNPEDEHKDSEIVPVPTNAKVKHARVEQHVHGASEEKPTSKGGDNTNEALEQNWRKQESVISFCDLLSGEKDYVRYVDTRITFGKDKRVMRLWEVLCNPFGTEELKKKEERDEDEVLTHEENDYPMLRKERNVKYDDHQGKGNEKEKKIKNGLEEEERRKIKKQFRKHWNEKKEREKERKESEKKKRYKKKEERKEKFKKWIKDEEIKERESHIRKEIDGEERKEDDDENRNDNEHLCYSSDDQHKENHNYESDDEILQQKHDDEESLQENHDEDDLHGNPNDQEILLENHNDEESLQDNQDDEDQHETHSDEENLYGNHNDKESVHKNNNDEESIYESHKDEERLHENHADETSLHESHDDETSLYENHDDETSLHASHDDDVMEKVTVEKKPRESRFTRMKKPKRSKKKKTKESLPIDKKSSKESSRTHKKKPKESPQKRVKKPKEDKPDEKDNEEDDSDEDESELVWREDDGEDRGWFKREDFQEEDIGEKDDEAKIGKENKGWKGKEKKSEKRINQKNSEKQKFREKRDKRSRDSEEEKAKEESSGKRSKKNRIGEGKQRKPGTNESEAYKQKPYKKQQEKKRGRDEYEMQMKMEIALLQNQLKVQQDQMNKIYSMLAEGKKKEESMGQAMTQTLEKFSNFVGNLTSSSLNHTSNIAEGSKQMFVTVQSMFDDISLSDDVKKKMNEGLEKVKDSFASFGSNVKDFVTNTKTQDIPKRVTTAFRSTVDSVRRFGKDMFKKARHPAKNVMSSFTRIVEDLKDGFKTQWTKVQEKFEDPPREEEESEYDSGFEEDLNDVQPDLSQNDDLKSTSENGTLAEGEWVLKPPTDDPKKGKGGEWQFGRADQRQKIREEESRSDWMFERARGREDNREKNMNDEDEKDWASARADARKNFNGYEERKGDKSKKYKKYQRYADKKNGFIEDHDDEPGDDDEEEDDGHDEEEAYEKYTSQYHHRESRGSKRNRRAQRQNGHHHHSSHKVKDDDDDKKRDRRHSSEYQYTKDWFFPDVYFQKVQDVFDALAKYYQ